MMNEGKEVRENFSRVFSDFAKNKRRRRRDVWWTRKEYPVTLAVTLTLTLTLILPSSLALLPLPLFFLS